MCNKGKARGCCRLNRRESRKRPNRERLELLKGIENRYYDELNREEQQRWWEYAYDGMLPLELAEQDAKSFLGTLHFECKRLLCDEDLKFIDKICESW